MQTCAHLVDPGLDARLKLSGQFEKGAVEPAVEDLERAHQVLNLACPRTGTLRLFLLGLFESRLEFGGELDFVFQEIIKQNTELRELGSRKFVQLGPDLFDLAHG